MIEGFPTPFASVNHRLVAGTASGALDALLGSDGRSNRASGHGCEPADI